MAATRSVSEMMRRQAVFMAGDSDGFMGCWDERRMGGAKSRTGMRRRAFWSAVAERVRERRHRFWNIRGRVGALLLPPALRNPKAVSPPPHSMLPAPTRAVFREPPAPLSLWKTSAARIGCDDATMRRCDVRRTPRAAWDRLETRVLGRTWDATAELTRVLMPKRRSIRQLIFQKVFRRRNEARREWR